MKSIEGRSAFRLVSATLTIIIIAAGVMAGGDTESQSQTQTSKSDLVDTSWQLIRFQGGDEKVLTPDDRSKYTISFGADGSVTVRFDCNRGRGTWKSEEANQLQFGPLALTRAMCPPGSLHDHFVKNWNYVRAYTLKNGHLYLSLMADAGIFEFEPLVKN